MSNINHKSIPYKFRSMNHCLNNILTNGSFILIRNHKYRNTINKLSLISFLPILRNHVLQVNPTCRGGNFRVLSKILRVILCLELAPNKLYFFTQTGYHIQNIVLYLVFQCKDWSIDFCIKKITQELVPLL